MKEVEISATDVASAREKILGLIQSNLNNNSVIYFDGWGALWARAVLRSIAQVLPTMNTPGLSFDIVIYIDCSKWISKRAMQRKIAEELKLDHKIMAMFDEQDEEDDFNGLDYGSREVIRSVSAAIDQFLRERSFMMIFINGSDDEITLGRFGIRESNDCVIIWTFSRCDMLPVEVISGRYHLLMKKLKFTDLYIHIPSAFSTPELFALLHQVAATAVASYPSMQDIDLTIVVHCFLYELLLHFGLRGTTSGLFWQSHSPNYWICDGIIPGGDDRAREIINVLQQEITIQCDDYTLRKVLHYLVNEDSESPPFLVGHYYGGYEKVPYRWIFPITLDDKIAHEDMISILLAEEPSIVLAEASSIFLGFKTKDSPLGLPNNFFKYCSHLGVLVVYCCSFSFVSPPFQHCHTLRFLGLDHCTDKEDNSGNAVERQGGWACLQSLCVIDLYYTDWVELLSEEKMNLMPNLTELNIEGARCSHLLRSWLQKRLPHLQRLRIIKPIYDDEADEKMSSDTSDSFLMDNTASLEILDLSGNSRGMRKLPASISEARHLQLLILDGCDRLEEVVVSGNTSLRSFSFDGCGPAASHRTSTIQLPPKHPFDGVKQSFVKTSKVSIKGCTQLHNLFLRGLHNMEELDLSGCAIKVLDFGSMVTDVPRLKRLFLLGCEDLQTIKWGSDKQQLKLLELLCIDTRPGSRSILWCARPPLHGAQVKVHATIADARLARSLWAPIEISFEHARHFNISINSSAVAFVIGAVQPEATTSNEMMVGSSCHQRHYEIAAARGFYCDIFTKVGNNHPTPMQAFPNGPTGQLDHHIEIGDGSRSLQSEVEAIPYFGNNLPTLMTRYTESLHVHDASACINTMSTGFWKSLKWCRVERCPNLQAVFPSDSEEASLNTIWASDLRMAHCIWSKGFLINFSDQYPRFRNLEHLHLRCCPSLQFALAIGRWSYFPYLKTLHIIHCGNLRHIFVSSDENKDTSFEFAKLTTIHLHDLPALQQICEAAEMLAPALETVTIKGCWSLRQLPALKGRKPGMRRPIVEIEKDVWGVLEWDGLAAGHHPSLYEAPVHSRYYKRRMLRTTVLR